MQFPLLSRREIPGTIGVITGGWSRERDRSLNSARAVMESLGRQQARAILVDPETENFLDQITQVGMAFLAIAGRGGEDGRLQGLLDTLDIPYTGSGVLASATGMHKPTAKMLVADAGLRVPKGLIVDRTAGGLGEAERLVGILGLPVALKPANEGGSIGLRVARDLAELAEDLSELSRSDTELLAEQFSPGRPVSVGVLEARAVDGEELYVLPPLEVDVPGGIYTYAAKRAQRPCVYHCPARLPLAMRKQLQAAAQAAHRALHCTGYSRHDFVVTGPGEAVWLEVNTLPGLTEQGNLARMADADGLSYDQLVAHIARGAAVDRRAQV
ncbi:D-alanine--D-alanine ligase family protein [Streptantibioticus ferralitis]|uniref:D-alanine--D-alanine ligase n=1 Tax=Streptantibioticus ferralitis TaxID=236510 RepID=A0ABT5Z1F0_9ACTN|nr:D-alanine--D-alanine ligase [Streptantibioticus ferralitis]MDF2257663.1 D-alanine--D-alanine ligase [Streptantibioticus ferralitis]